ncbi:MAG: hypothetical protein ACI942_000747, partial [Planctomycetota bacterium]
PFLLAEKQSQHQKYNHTGSNAYNQIKFLIWL